MQDFLLFNIQDRRFAVVLAAVRRVVRMVEVTPLPDAPAVMSGVVNLHGEVVSVYDLRIRCGLPPRPPLPSDHLLIAKAGERTVALPVDAVEGVLTLQEEELHPLDKVVPEIRNAAGIATVQGNIVLICDLGRLLAPTSNPEDFDALHDIDP